jgi:hypothetical protein
MTTCVCFSFQKQKSSYFLIRRIMETPKCSYFLLNKESNGNMESKSVFTMESKRDYMWEREKIVRGD